MTQPKSLDAYRDCEEYFERAAASTNGIAITLDNPSGAIRFRLKMNSFRVLLRKQSKEVRQPEDPQYGLSPYDSYELSIDKDDPCRVLVRRYNLRIKKLEEL